MKYEPEKWHTCRGHDWKTCTQGVNCYSYILNNPDYFWSVPGVGFAHTKGQVYMRAFDKYFEDVTVGEFQKMLIDGAVKDGLVKIDKPQDKNGYYLAALFFSKDHRDFHWYRRDDDGTWSGKDGWREATNKDNNGSLISDPKNIQDTHYSVFGGYFQVSSNGITLKETFPL